MLLQMRPSLSYAACHLSRTDRAAWFQQLVFSTGTLEVPDLSVFDGTVWFDEYVDQFY